MKNHYLPLIMIIVLLGIIVKFWPLAILLVFGILINSSKPRKR